MGLPRWQEFTFMALPEGRFVGGWTVCGRREVMVDGPSRSGYLRTASEWRFGALLCWIRLSLSLSWLKAISGLVLLLLNNRIVLPATFLFSLRSASRFSAQRTTTTMNRRAKDLALALGATSLLLAALNVQRPPPAPHYAEEVLKQCAHLNAPVSTHATHRTESDRFVAGVKPVLITNASLWTGGDNGNEVVQYGDILLDRGIIKAAGNVPRSLLRAYLEDGDIESVNAEHAWITPGIVDIHSHIAVYPSPAAKGPLSEPEGQGLH